MSDEKLCLKWNDFQDVVRASFGELRYNSDFTDVTLACEDQTIKAHRVILAGGSPFFKRLFKTHSHPQALIYMRGLKFNDLMSMLDFLYQGEAKVYQEELQTFLALAEELELKGLNGSEEELLENKEATQQHNKESFKQNPSRINFGPSKIADEDTKLSKIESNQNIFQRTLVSTHQKETKSLIDSDTMRIVNSLIEKQFDRHACLKCNYTSTDRRNIKKHVEKHIEGLSYPCTFCGKVSTTSNRFRVHQTTCQYKSNCWSKLKILKLKKVTQIIKCE